MTSDAIAPLAVSMGEPAGVGTELILKAWKNLSALPKGKGPVFYLIDDPVRVDRLARSLYPDTAVATISTPEETGDVFYRALPVLSLPTEVIADLKSVTLGTPTPKTAAAVIRSIDTAIAAIHRGEAGGLVTLPIQKQTLMAAGFQFPGHTEYLEHATAEMAMPVELERGAVMILTAGPFRVVPATVHIPLAEVTRALSTDLLIRRGRTLMQSLRRDYGIVHPRLAVSGLNPHAGEGGVLGREEEEIIAPAITALAKEGYVVEGPFPADTLFHDQARAAYDAVLAMYHDQALVPIKTVAFHAAVNTTLGLPIVRTSPDHGTALALAGKGVARADSLINAIYSAHRISTARLAFDSGAYAADV
ncbi:4-hydroxythreonine-4-phosphate dehydrogenase [Parvularcula bermudensis HTCC2503]|uniref:4-hydroxythreonine-4-phosphate dehydrogenase n=1 Tax=Parvularcula bermudensis (strain ATCC BAA-594 / HTCC2503 / KCTC 12087) TaxID=314260 RepID=E0TCB1_PARBH|nr:4-hydroxythreonine-4-phosphate dehydrogenase PdxA [Parvularcula bermudensis]ADM08544.1 4-hydroxythreonine-4-phosphate dehydrogenase [Parvularcula bermudensis HTCC2503]